MVYRIRAGLRKFARAIVVLTERAVHRPLSNTTKKKLAMSATRRASFSWNIARGTDKTFVPEEHSLFVRVEKDVIEDAVAESFPEAPIVEETPYPTASPTSSGAMMYEFSSSRFDFDSLDMDENVTSTETVEETVKECVETEDDEYFEGLYDDLTVEAVLAYMDTIELYATPVLAIEQPSVAGFIEPPVSQISGLLATPYVYEESEEEKAFFEDLYDDLTVEAVLEYMDTIELYATVREESTMMLAAPQTTGLLEAPAEYAMTEDEEFFESLFEDLGVAAVIEYMDSFEAEDEKAFFEDLYDDLAVEAALDCMDRFEKEEEEFFNDLYDDLVVDAVLECMDRFEKEEEEFFQDLYDDLTVEAVLEYMDSMEAGPEYVPEYVISEIQVPEVCETQIAVEAPVEEIVSEAPVQKAAVHSMLTQFVFGFDTPAVAKTGGTRFRFIAGEEDEPEEDIEDVQVLTYSGDAAVSAQSFSNGTLAL